MKFDFFGFVPHRLLHPKLAAPSAPFIYATGLQIFTRATLCHSAGISCRRVSVCLSVTRRYCIETAARVKLIFSRTGFH